MSAKSAVKAIDYPSPDTLLQLDQYIVDALDFTGFPEKYGFEKLDQIFPKDPKYGKEDPPPPYLTAGRRVRDWRKISRSNQLHAIDNPPRPVVSRGSSRRATRRRGLCNVLTAPDQNLSENSQLHQVVASAPPPVATPLRPSSPAPASQPALAAPIVQAWPRQETLPCRGLSKQAIEASNLSNKDALLSGFWHLYGNACRVKASYRSNHCGKWPYDANVEGLILDTRKETDDPSCLDEFSWMCVSLPPDGTVVWKNRNCEKETSSNSGCCNTCWTRRRSLKSKGKLWKEEDIFWGGAGRGEDQASANGEGGQQVDS